jgi:hypothetical protein
MSEAAAKVTAQSRYRQGVKAAGGRIVEVRLSRSQLDTLDLLTEQLGIGRRELFTRWIEDERAKQGLPKLED